MWPKSAILLADLDHMTANLVLDLWPNNNDYAFCFQKKMWPLTFHQVWPV